MTGPMDRVRISFTLNGEPVATEVHAAERLLDLLRYRLRLPGTKEGCAEGECGACTVWMDGLPVDACLIPAYQARGRDVRTVESLDSTELEPFLEGGATQCGACTPGVAMTARWVLEHPEVLDRFTLRELMAGNLCRCTGYDGIVDSLRTALRARGVAVSEPAAPESLDGRASEGPPPADRP